MKRKYFPMIGMGFLLVFTEGLAIFLSAFFKAKNLRAFNKEPGSLMNPVYLIVIILGFTAVFLVSQKFKLEKAIQLFIGFAVFVTLVYSFMGLIWQFYPIGIKNLVILAAAFSLALTSIYLKYRKWYIINILGLLVGGGAAAIFGFSLEIGPVLILLTALAIYDAIAVYKTEHMMDLAGSAIDLKIPIMFIMPWKKGFSLNKQNIDGEEKEAFFMGVGDTVMPSVLVVSAFIYSSNPLVTSASVMIGSLIGFVFLSSFVLKGKAQAGLPLLNGGAILGYLTSYLLF